MPWPFDLSHSRRKAVQRDQDGWPVGATASVQLRRDPFVIRLMYGGDPLGPRLFSQARVSWDGAAIGYFRDRFRRGGISIAVGCPAARQQRER